MPDSGFPESDSGFTATPGQAMRDDPLGYVSIRNTRCTGRPATYRVSIRISIPGQEKPRVSWRAAQGAPIKHNRVRVIYFKTLFGMSTLVTTNDISIFRIPRIHVFDRAVTTLSICPGRTRSHASSQFALS